MTRPATSTDQLPPLQTFSIEDALPHFGVRADAWSFAFEKYLAQLLLQHEEELHPAVPRRTLNDDQLMGLLVLAARLGATAGIAAIDTLRPPEPPF